jgi:hypothetical protein
VQEASIDRRIIIDRRQQTLNSLLFGAWRHRRRRATRRPADDQRVLVDWYDPGLFMVAMAIVTMSCLDAIFTLKLLSLGGEELNWVMLQLLETDLRLFLWVKYMVTTGGVILLVALSRVRMLGVLRVRNVLQAIGGIYICLIIYELYLLLAVATGYVA